MLKATLKVSKLGKIGGHRNTSQTSSKTIKNFSL